jgi:spore germination protein YaaH
MKRLAWLTAVAVAISGAGAAYAAGRAPGPPPAPPRVFAFVSRQGGVELERLSQVGARIDVVAPNWYELAPDSGTLREPTGTDRDRLLGVASAHGVRVWPVVNARTGGSRAWEAAAARGRIVDALRTVALAPGASGVTLDMEELSGEQRDAFATLAGEAAAALHAVDRRLAVYVSRTGDAYDWEAIARKADLLLAAGYNESYAGSKPGPITTEKGFANVVDRAVDAGGRGKAVPLLGAFGYRWPRTGRGELIGSTDALALRRGTRSRASVADGNERFTLGDDTIVYATAAGLRARWHDAVQARVRWIGLFSLGREPAHFWDHLDTARLSKPKIKGQTP